MRESERGIQKPLVADHQSDALRALKLADEGYCILHRRPDGGRYFFLSDSNASRFTRTATWPAFVKGLGRGGLPGIGFVGILRPPVPSVRSEVQGSAGSRASSPEATAIIAPLGAGLHLGVTLAL